MKMNRSRPILCSVNEIRCYMSTKSRIPSHYDTLNVTKESTQDDIKSAYYSLSKKLHPDVNKAVNAKQQFQDVSDAYEVLGNFTKRKQYDRDLAARGGNATVRRPAYTTMDEDPMAAFYRSRMSNYDNLKTHNTQRNYNFDAWTQAHYGQTLRRTLKDKQSKAFKEEMRRQYKKDMETERSSQIFMLICGSVCMISLAIQAYFSPEYDRNYIKKNDKK